MMAETCCESLRFGSFTTPTKPGAASGTASGRAFVPLSSRWPGRLRAMTYIDYNEYALVKTEARDGPGCGCATVGSVAQDLDARGFPARGTRRDARKRLDEPDALCPLPAGRVLPEDSLHRSGFPWSVSVSIGRGISCITLKSPAGVDTSLLLHCVDSRLSFATNPIRPVSRLSGIF
jgi:hypothetical protein